MELDDHQKRRVLDWLLARAGGLGCHACGLAEYKIDPGLYHLPGRLPGPAAAPIEVVALVCGHCGHVRLHSAVKMEVAGPAAAAPGDPAPGPTPRAEGGPLPPP